jgi:hypothetical protein
MIRAVAQRPVRAPESAGCIQLLKFVVPKPLGLAPL